MPRFCAVFNCGTRADRDKKSLFRIPAVLSRATQQKIDLSRRRRESWIKALKRADLNEEKIKYLWICQDHFILGKPADLCDTDNPDWIPSKDMGYKVHSSAESATLVNRYLRAKKRQMSSPTIPPFNVTDPPSDLDENEMSLPENQCAGDLNLNDNDVSTNEDSNMFGESCIQENPRFLCSVTTQTELTCNDISVMQETLSGYVKDISILKSDLTTLQINEKSFEKNNEKTLYYTGLPTFAALMIIFETIASAMSERSSLILTKFQRFILTLMHLRLNLDFKDLAYRFGVSRTTASKTFYDCLHILHVKLSAFILWPDRESLKILLPQTFRDAFGDRVTVIIDCFEIFIEKPSNLEACAETYSHYKHHHTAKILIGICPQGAISYISNAWGGRTSDKYITENCGILENLLPGDLILADRGFTISDAVTLYCAEVKVPPFLKGRKQLSAVEVEQTRNLAHVRIHVERVIGALRQKYRIFGGIMPISLISKHFDSHPSALDQIITVCAALFNVCPSVMPFD